MRVCKNWGQGCYVVSDIVDNHLVTKLYYGYTKDEVISHFREDVRYLHDPNYEPSEVVDETFSN